MLLLDYHDKEIKNDAQMKELEGDYSIIKTKEDFEKAKQRVDQLFISGILPIQVFKNEDWNFMFLESWNIFDNNTYNNFIDFIKDFNEQEIYLTPDYIEKINIDSYLEDCASHFDRRGIPLLRFGPDLSFKDFNALQNKYAYRDATNSFLFGTNKDWGVYVDTEIDIMVLGIAHNLKSIAEKHYKNHSDHIVSVDRLIDYVYLWNREDEDEKDLIKRELLKNYNTAFK